MELSTQLDRATLSEKAEISIVPIEVGLRANRSFLLEKQKAEKASKTKPGATTIDGTTSKSVTAATQPACSSNSVLGLNFT